LKQALLVSPKITFSPFTTGFFEAGADFGLLHGNKDIQGRLFQNPVGADQRSDETTSWKKRLNTRFFS
jgi:hypothetical protein